MLTTDSQDKVKNMALLFILQRSAWFVTTEGFFMSAANLRRYFLFVWRHDHWTFNKNIQNMLYFDKEKYRKNNLTFL